MDSKRPDPAPEGILISNGIKRAGLSARKAAERAGISEGWWRQIVRGYQNLSGGGYGTVRGPAETIARMAHVAGVTADQLEAAGRQDAADELCKLPVPPAPAPSAPPQERDGLRASIIAAALEGLTAAEAEQILEEELRRRRETPPGEGDSHRVS